MRVTTKVIQGNSIANINNNKVLQDKLNNQMATEKKIVRPSDDPVVAIRALRLRTNVSQVTQYYDELIELQRIKGQISIELKFRRYLFRRYLERLGHDADHVLFNLRSQVVRVSHLVFSP